MNSGKAQRDREHREATRVAAQEPCLACDRPAPSEPCHYLTGRSGHRGMGGGKAGWSPQEWCPLCRECHNALDKRSGLNDPYHEFVVASVELGIATWRARW